MHRVLMLLQYVLRAQSTLGNEIATNEAFILYTDRFESKSLCKLDRIMVHVDHIARKSRI